MEAEIRKLRKKLRQIENLECLARALTYEESIKIQRKEELRDRLQDLLTQAEIPSIDKECEDDLITEDDDIIDFCDESTKNIDKVTTKRKQLEHENSKSSISEASIRTEPGAEPEPPKRSRQDQEVNADGDKRYNQQHGGTSTSIPVADSRGDSASAGQVKPPPVTRPSSQPGRKVSPVVEAARRVKAGRYVVTELVGHNDVIHACCCGYGVIVTAGRDTMVKIWCGKTLQELRSLGGHRETVTALCFLPTTSISGLNMETDDNFSLDVGETALVSSSYDCTLKFWSLTDGKLLKSVYVYNPVSCMTHFNDGYILIGTCGGKLELWTCDGGAAVASALSHDEGLVSIQVSEQSSKVVTAGQDDMVKVWEVRATSGESQGLALHCVYASEEPRSRNGDPVKFHGIRCLSVHGDTVYIGDSGDNLKVLDWRKGIVYKLRNNVQENFGCTDAVCMDEYFVYSSAYDLDSGHSYINVRLLANDQYVCSLHLPDGLPRVFSLHRASYHGDGRAQGRCHLDLELVTSGRELHVWRLQAPGATAKPKTGEAVVRANFHKVLHAASLDSGTESEVSDYDIDDEDSTDDDMQDTMDSNSGERETTDSWLSRWCSIM